MNLLSVNIDQLQPQAFNTEPVVNAFLSQIDCKESSRALYRRTLKQFFAWVQRSGRTLGDLGRADILQYRDGIISGDAMPDGKPRSSLTAAAYLTVVKLFYKWLFSMGAYPDISAGVKMPERRKRYEREPLSKEEAGALCAQVEQAASLRNIAIINLLLRTGVRTIEAARANVGDLREMDGRKVLYVQGKGRIEKDNFVILSPKCCAALHDYLQTRPGAGPAEPLFISESNRNTGGRITTRAISGIVKDALRAIGLSGREYTAHSLRHTFGCEMLEETGDLYATQKAMRHASPATTEAYTYHIDERLRLRNAAEYRLDELF